MNEKEIMQQHLLEVQAAYDEALLRVREAISTGTSYANLYGQSPPNFTRQLADLRDAAVQLAIQGLLIRADILRHTLQNPFDGMAIPEEF